MTTEALYNEVVQIISKYSRAEEAMKGVSRSSSILGDLKVNSTRFVDILIEFEDKYNLQISDDDADKIETVGDAVDLLNKLIH
jgi:acyl carrier protein